MIPGSIASCGGAGQAGVLKLAKKLQWQDLVDKLGADSKKEMADAK